MPAKGHFCTVNHMCMGAGYYCLETALLQFSPSHPLTSIKLLKHNFTGLMRCALTAERLVFMQGTPAEERGYAGSTLQPHSALCGDVPGLRFPICQILEAGNMISSGSHTVFPLDLSASQPGQIIA